MRGMSTPLRPAAPPEAPSLARAVEALSRGNLVAFPTETVYGLGADATNPEAVAKIFAAKGRPADHPLIVHLAPEARLDDWAVDIPEAARSSFAPSGPARSRSSCARRRACPPPSRAARTRVGLRCPSHPVAQALLREFARAGSGAVAAPSANKFGHVSPTTAQHVRDEFGPDLLVIDGGACAVGLESTILDLSRGEPVLLRPGDVSRQAIERVLGVVPRDRDADAPRASGTLASHYAPRAPLVLVERSALASRIRAGAGEGKRVAVLFRGAAQPVAAAFSRIAPDDAAALRARPLCEPARAGRERRRPDRCRTTARHRRVGSRPGPIDARRGGRRRSRRNLKGTP